MKKALILASTLLLGACNSLIPKPVNVAMLQPIELDKDPNVNTNNEIRLVFMGFEDKHSEQGLKLAAQAESQSRRQMLDKGVEIVDVERSIRGQLGSEIELIEAGGSSEFSLPKAANIAMRGELSSATLTQTWYEEKEPLITGKGLPDVIPAHCVYKSTVSGAVIFYDVNPVKRRNSFTFSGSAETKINGANCYGLKSSAERDLHFLAVNNGISNVGHKLMNVLARSGFVTSALQDAEKPDKVYYRLSIKPNEGAIPGVKVTFFEMRQGPNGQQEKIPFGEGRIACTNHASAAYAAVTEPNLVAKIKVNTPVKLKYKDDPVWEEMLRTMFPCNP